MLTLELLVAIIACSLECRRLHLSHHAHLIASLDQAACVDLEAEGGNRGHQEVVVDVMENVEHLPHITRAPTCH